MDRLKIRSAFFVFAMFALLAPPVQAQDMGDNGFTLPAFLFSRGTQMARANCINNLPNCRPDVRQELEIERGVTLIVPWFLLAGVLAAALVYMQRREKQKQKARKIAQQKHVSTAARRKEEDADDAADRERDRNRDRNRN